MADVSKTIQEIVHWAADRYADDIDEAVNAAVRKHNRLGQAAKEAFAPTAVELALRGMIGDRRHSVNQALHKRECQEKTARGLYGQPAKVAIGKDPDIVKSELSLYDMRVAGTTLGALQGDRLQDIGDREIKIGKGHVLTGRLCLALRPFVPDDQRVRNAVSDNKIKQLMSKLAKDKTILLPVPKRGCRGWKHKA